jgi:hypothetical protein
LYKKELQRTHDEHMKSVLTSDSVNDSIALIDGEMILKRKRDGTSTNSIPDNVKHIVTPIM